MSGLLATRQAIKAALVSSIRLANQITEHPGPFTLEELLRLSTRNPSLIVVCQGVPSIQRQAAGVLFGEGVFAVFVVTSDQRELRRDALAMLLAEQVAQLAANNTWNDAASKTPTDIVLTNLYSTALDAKGVSLWAVRWRQLVQFANASTSTLDDFERTVAEYTVGSEESSDQVELET